MTGLIAGGKQPPGALLPMAQVDLRLLDHKDLELPAPDPAFTREMLNSWVICRHYGVAVLDLTDPAHPRYAEHRGDHRQNVGSVGKLVVALALFQALADTWPDDLAKRRQILEETIVTADGFSHTDHHTIRLYDVATKKLTRRTMLTATGPLVGIPGLGALRQFQFRGRHGHARSHAAAPVWQDYPPSEEEIERFFRDTPQ